MAHQGLKILNAVWPRSQLSSAAECFFPLLLLRAATECVNLFEKNMLTPTLPQNLIFNIYRIVFV